MKITFKLHPRETGLLSVGAAPRGWVIKVDGNEVGHVYPSGGDWRSPLTGWYFVISGDGYVYKNTCNVPAPTPEQARAAAKEHILGHASS